MKLIRLNPGHYIVVNNTEIKIGDYNVPSDVNSVKDLSITGPDDLDIVNDPANGYMKVIYSTQPIENSTSDGAGIELINLTKDYSATTEFFSVVHILTKLCLYDTRNPNYLPFDEEDPSLYPKDCACDNCFYGRTELAEIILKLSVGVPK